MSQAFLNNIYFSKQEINIRDNPVDLWSDYLSYACNLYGNWFVSRDIFLRNLVPTAEKNPALFAKWIDDMVKISGVKILQKSSYISSLKLSRKTGMYEKHAPSDIKKALTLLFNAGLDKPIYAKKAIDSLRSYRYG